MVYLGNFEYSTTPVPEPSVALLGALSLGGLLRRRR
jgi:MYXO-CTERM domain-containing protein